MKARWKIDEAIANTKLNPTLRKPTDMGKQHDIMFNDNVKQKKGQLSEDEFELKRKIFKLPKMEALVFGDDKLASVYNQMANKGEDKYGYHFNETIMNMIFNDYVLKDTKYLQKYKQSVPIEKKRRGKEEIEKRLRQGRKDREGTEAVQGEKAEENISHNNNLPGVVEAGGQVVDRRELQDVIEAGGLIIYNVNGDINNEKIKVQPLSINGGMVKIKDPKWTNIKEIPVDWVNGILVGNDDFTKGSIDVNVVEDNFQTDAPQFGYDHERDSIRRTEKQYDTVSNVMEDHGHYAPDTAFHITVSDTESSGGWKGGKGWTPEEKKFLRDVSGKIGREILPNSKVDTLDHGTSFILISKKDVKEWMDFLNNRDDAVFTGDWTSKGIYDKIIHQIGDSIKPFMTTESTRNTLEEGEFLEQDSVKKLLNMIEQRPELRTEILRDHIKKIYNTLKRDGQDQGFKWVENIQSMAYPNTDAILTLGNNDNEFEIMKQGRNGLKNYPINTDPYELVDNMKQTNESIQNSTGPSRMDLQGDDLEKEEPIEETTSAGGSAGAANGASRADGYQYAGPFSINGKKQEVLDRPMWRGGEIVEGVNKKLNENYLIDPSGYIEYIERIEESELLFEKDLRRQWKDIATKIEQEMRRYQDGSEEHSELRFQRDKFLAMSERGVEAADEPQFNTEAIHNDSVVPTAEGSFDNKGNIESDNEEMYWEEGGETLKIEQTANDIGSGPPESGHIYVRLENEMEWMEIPVAEIQRGAQAPKGTDSYFQDEGQIDEHHLNSKEEKVAFIVQYGGNKYGTIEDLDMMDDQKIDQIYVQTEKEHPEYKQQEEGRVDELGNPNKMNSYGDYQKHDAWNSKEFQNRPKKIADIQNDDSYKLVTDSQQIDDILWDIFDETGIDRTENNYDGIFVKYGNNNEVEAVYSFDGNVPELTKSLERLDTNWEDDPTPQHSYDGGEPSYNKMMQQRHERPFEGEMDEKAVSKKQQKFMGMVHAAQKGELDNPSKEVKDVATSIKPDDAEDFASTKHKGLPEKKRENKTDETETYSGRYMASPSHWIGQSFEYNGEQHTIEDLDVDPSYSMEGGSMVILTDENGREYTALGGYNDPSDTLDWIDYETLELKESMNESMIDDNPEAGSMSMAADNPTSMKMKQQPFGGGDDMGGMNSDGMDGGFVGEHIKSSNDNQLDTFGTSTEGLDNTNSVKGFMPSNEKNMQTLNANSNSVNVTEGTLDESCRKGERPVTGAKMGDRKCEKIDKSKPIKSAAPKQTKKSFKVKNLSPNIEAGKKNSSVNKSTGEKQDSENVKIRKKRERDALKRKEDQRKRLNPKFKTNKKMSENIENVNEEKRPSALIQLDRLKDSNEKNFKKDLKNNRSIEQAVKAKKDPNFYINQDVDEAQKHDSSEKIEKDVLKGKEKDALKDVGDSTRKPGQIPKRNNTADENDDLMKNRGGGMEDLEYDEEPSDEFEDRMKEGMGDEIYNNRKNKMDYKSKAPMYNKDTQPTDDDSSDQKEQFNNAKKNKSFAESITAKYIDNLGNRKFVEVYLTEDMKPVEIFGVDDTYAELVLEGLGNIYGTKVSVDENVKNFLKNNTYYLKENKVYFTKNKVEVITESEDKTGKNEKESINEDFQKLKHLMGYNPNSYIQ